MGRRSKTDMPRIAVVKPHHHARVRIGGQAYWLGKCPNKTITQRQHAEAARLWHQFLKTGMPPEQQQKKKPSGQSSSGKHSVKELADKYLEYAETYYQHADGTPTSSVSIIHMALRSLSPWNHLCAESFGPKTLKSLQNREIGRGRPRVTVNRITKTIRQIFKWAASEEIVSATVWHALCTVACIRKGRTIAHEIKPIEEVPDWVVTATMPFVSPVVAAMIGLQRWTGMRPGEVVIIRPCDIDRSNEIWIYQPLHFKTDWQVNAKRVVPIGLEGQKILLPFLDRQPEDFCFSPEESEAWRSTKRRKNRQSPMTPSQKKRKPKANGQRRPGIRYDSASYRRAIKRGINTANKQREKDGLELLPDWSPNQLRHLRAGELEETLGIEMASALLGHSKVETTAIYARRKQQLAIKAARMTG